MRVMRLGEFYRSFASDSKPISRVGRRGRAGSASGPSHIAHGLE